MKKMTGAQLRKLRERLGYTQTELGEKLWLSEKSKHRSVCAWENGERGIQPLLQLCLAYLEKFGPLSRP